MRPCADFFSPNHTSVNNNNFCSFKIAQSESSDQNLKIPLRMLNGYVYDSTLVGRRLGFWYLV